MIQQDDVIQSIRECNSIPEEFIEILTNQKKIFFYGGGNQGFICEDILVNSLKIEVSGFIVSDGQPAKTKWNSSLPIYPLSEMPYEKGEVNILLTLGYSVAVKIREILYDSGYQNICLIKNWDEMNEVLRNISLEHMLKRNGYAIKQGESFEINGFKFIDPYQNTNVYSMFVREFENITSERIFGERNRYKIDSSYEYDAVVLEEGDIVFDCGANIGLFSALAATCNCKVYAFEPASYIAQYTRKVADLYEGKITVISKALVEKTGTIDFLEANEADKYLGDSSKVIQNQEKLEPHYHVVRVACTTVDEIAKEYQLEKVDFIKADIEGAERLMLQGAQDVLKKFAPKLAICTYHLPDDREVLTKIIMDANPSYKIVYQWDKLYAYVPKK